MMKQAALLKTLLFSLTQPWLRDLAWALLSPPLAHTQSLTLRHPLTASGWGQDPEQLAHWLKQQDNQPAPTRLLGQRRLGRYYEALWLWALNQAADISVLANNLAIYQGSQTVGELDVLFEDAQGLHHLELALKFYLQHGEQWLGPDPRDCLANKLKHLSQKQLKLTEQPATQAALGAMTDQPLHCAAWLGGRLFAAWPKQSPDTQSDWLRAGQWSAYTKLWPACQIVQLAKTAWLAPLNQPTEAFNPAVGGAFAVLSYTQGRWHELRRGFVMADSWPLTTQD